MSRTFDEHIVGVWKSERAEYASRSPFHPDSSYPEFADSPVGMEKNPAFTGVREALHLAGLDSERFGAAEWNPLAQFIEPGQTVLLKPNFVKEFHPRDPQGWVYVLTHGSVIRAVADYVFKALDGKGTVIVGDAPQTDSSFRKVAEVLQLQGLVEYYKRKGLDFQLLDFRKEEWTNDREVITERRVLAGDPNGYVAYDLAESSEFYGHSGTGRYYGADYDAGVVNEHHNGIKNEYLISGTAIKCDVYINLPKLKTHKKAGVTINLKNLVGINGDKNWLPHHTEGAPADGGDQFPDTTLGRRSENALVHTFKRLALNLPGVGPRLMQFARPIGARVFGSTDTTVRSGNWHGNDTVWRMSLDLNKLELYGRMDGTLRPDATEFRKTYLCFVDGIIAGQGNGPMDPDPYPAGVTLFGANPAVVDAVGAVLMGFDLARTPVVSKAFAIKRYRITDCQIEDIVLRSNHSLWNGALTKLRYNDIYHFRPHFGWIGQIERQPEDSIKERVSTEPASAE